MAILNIDTLVEKNESEYSSSQLNQLQKLHPFVNFESLLDETAEIAVLLDSEGTIYYVNKNGYRLLGYTPEELLNKNWFNLFISESTHETLLSYHHSTREQISTKPNQKNSVYENDILCKDQIPLTIRWHNTIITDNNNTVYGSFSIGEDITIQVQTHSLLRAREDLRLFSESHTLNELLQELLDICEKMTKSSIGFFHFVERDQITLNLQTWSTNTLKHMCSIEKGGLHYSANSAGVWVEALFNRAPVIHNDYMALKHKKGLPPGHTPVSRELVVPVFEGESIVALLGVGNKTSPYSQYDQEILQELSELVWMIVSKKKVEQMLEEANQRLQSSLLREKLLSQQDELTRIYSRRFLLELTEHELSTSKRYANPLVIIMFDIDNFKRINDIYGHPAGDKVLRDICTTIMKELRSCDIFGRLGGEEFVIVLPQVDSDEGFLLGERIRKVIEQLKMIYENHTLQITISIGITAFNPISDFHTTVEKLILRADKALYQAKDSGKNCTVVL